MKHNVVQMEPIYLHITSVFPYPNLWPSGGTASLEGGNYDCGKNHNAEKEEKTKGSYKRIIIERLLILSPIERKCKLVH